MSNLQLVLNAILLTTTLASIAAPQNNKEWEISRLMSPTFPEVQSEAVYSTITCYSYIDDATINEALNKHFERIQFMSFGDCHQGDK